MSAYRNRNCLAGGKDFEPSVEYAFECDTDSKLNKGCK